jgi:hypothetical protein
MPDRNPTRRKAKTWLVFNKFDNVVLVDPMAAFGATADAGKAVGMMADTVHLKEEGYTAVAQQCKKIITDWLLKAANPEAKKQKIESAGQTVPQSIAGTSGTGGRKSNQPVVKGRKETVECGRRSKLDPTSLRLFLSVRFLSLKLQKSEN